MDPTKEIFHSYCIFYLLDWLSLVFDNGPTFLITIWVCTALKTLFYGKTLLMNSYIVILSCISLS